MAATLPQVGGTSSTILLQQAAGSWALHSSVCFPDSVPPGPQGARVLVSISLTQHQGPYAGSAHVVWVIFSVSVDASHHQVYSYTQCTPRPSKRSPYPSHLQAVGCSHEKPCVQPPGCRYSATREPAQAAARSAEPAQTLQPPMVDSGDGV